MVDPWLAASGFVVGVLVGLTGVGGGALMTPVLILLFGVRPALAVGSDLAYAAVEWPLVLGLLVGFVPGVWLGSRLALVVPRAPLRAGVAVILGGIGVSLIRG